MKTLAVRDSAQNGYYNMAADICLMKLVESGRAMAAFRTYMWEPHCLSIGRFQKPEREADIEKLLAGGYHIVRRPTGGRAVWHGDELTYSVVAGEDHPLVSGGISSSLTRIAGILTSALIKCGIPAQLNTSERELSGRERIHNPCFTSHGRFEIMTPDGRKIVGSAQARSRGVFIEHGSILFTNQQLLAVDYLPSAADSTMKDRMKEILMNGVGTVREFNGTITRENLAEALHREFENAVSFSPERFQSKDLPGLKETADERRGIIEL